MATSLKAILLVCSLFGSDLILSAQESGDLFADLLFSHEIEDKLRSGEFSASKAAYYYTYIGNYKRALELYDHPVEWGLDTMSMADSIAFLRYEPFDAFEYLADRIKDEQIVLISEAHHKPQHRVFTLKLLSVLRDNGFSKIGIETLTPNSTDLGTTLVDTMLHVRGYPLSTFTTGTYTREPQMGHLVREAIDRGFELFAYEKTTGDLDRDLQQALNIIRYMEKHPQERIVIHCGWYHVIESNFPKRGDDNYLAFHLKRLTGIDPLTIYQDVLSEKEILPESPYYKCIGTDAISVLVDNNGMVFNGMDSNHHFDILIYHPRTTYKKNRPQWLFETEGYHFTEIEKAAFRQEQYPLMVIATSADEELTATPWDIVELKDPTDETAFVLQTGQYRIIVVDSERNYFEYLEEVKN